MNNLKSETQSRQIPIPGKGLNVHDCLPDLESKVSEYPPLPWDASKSECGKWAYQHPAANTTLRKRLLSHLAHLMTFDLACEGGVYESQKSMAGRIGASRRAVKYALRFFEKHGVIEVEHRYHAGTRARRSSLYILPVTYGGGAKVGQNCPTYNRYKR